MTAGELGCLIRSRLRERCDTSRGQVLYSGIDTVQRGPYYFVGFNPAADGTNPLLRDVPLDRTNWSAYKHQCWQCGAERDCVDHKRKLHQRQVLAIMKELDLCPEKTFATNLFFVESRTIRDLDVATLWPACWAVHQRLLADIRPQVIICLGNGDQESAFSRLKKTAIDTGPTFEQDRRKACAAMFDLGEGEHLDTHVIGVRHPSRPMNSVGLRDFIKAIQAAA